MSPLPPAPDCRTGWFELKHFEEIVLGTSSSVDLQNNDKGYGGEILKSINQELRIHNAASKGYFLNLQIAAAHYHSTQLGVPTVNVGWISTNHNIPSFKFDADHNTISLS